MSNVVFDYTPRGTPPTFNDAILEAMHNALDSGGTATEVYDAMADEEVRQLRSNADFQDELRDAYRQAGVDVVSPSIGRMHYEELDQRLANHVDLTRWSARIDGVDWLHQVTEPSEAEEVASQNDVGVVFNTQNIGGAVAGNVAEVENLYNAGVRIAQLTYNQHNNIGSGAVGRSDGRLSNHGLEVLEKLNELGVVVDLSHCSRRTTLDAIELSDAPVAYTHTVCQSLSGVARGQSDEEIEALEALDGYMGIVAVPYFLSPDDPDRSFEAFFDHLEHAISILGVDRVGVACDWGLWTPDVPEPLQQRVAEALRGMKFSDESVHVNVPFGPMKTYTDRSVIRDGLESRDYTSSEIDMILGGNFLSYWQRVIDSSDE